jgi:CRP/FNR family transcriptional activator FtrB
MQSIETMLRTAPGFAQLDDGSLETVAAACELGEVRSGDALFRQGMLPEWLYVLLEGRVSLTGTCASSSSAVIDIVEPASSFVLANVLTDEPYLMGAETICDSLLLRIGAQQMREVVEAQPAVAMAMIHAMSAELGSMTRQIVDLKVRIAAQRLGTYLLSQVKEPQATVAQFRLPVPKGLLGPWLGCRAENLSRAFASLRSYGVETHGSRVVLHDVGRLRVYAGILEPMTPAADQRAPVEKVLGDAFRLRRSR